MYFAKDQGVCDFHFNLPVAIAVQPWWIGCHERAWHDTHSLNYYSDPSRWSTTTVLCRFVFFFCWYTASELRFSPWHGILIKTRWRLRSQHKAKKRHNEFNWFPVFEPHPKGLKYFSPLLLSRKRDSFVLVWLNDFSRSEKFHLSMKYESKSISVVFLIVWTWWEVLLIFSMVHSRMPQSPSMEKQSSILEGIFCFQ